MGAKSLIAERMAIAMIDYTTPVNAKKKYEDLSKEEKALWRSLNYDEMDENDSPPFPMKGLVSLLGPIAGNNISEEVEGLLALHVVVGPDGVPLHADLFNSPSEKLGIYAVNVLMQARYSAAICKGTPCTMSFPLRVFVSHTSKF